MDTGRMSLSSPSSCIFGIGLILASFHMSGNWFILMKLFIIKVIGDAKNSETGFMKDEGIWPYPSNNHFVSFLYTFQYCHM